MIPFKIFMREIQELEVFYQMIVISIEEANQRSVFNNLNDSNREKFDALKQTETYQFYESNILKAEENFLRSLVFIRLISALEVYLVDNIKYVFLKSRKPFRSETRVEFSQSQLLSFSSITELHENLINKECRQLSSGGLEKIIRYYKAKFSIDIGSIRPGKNIMEEYHDRRHILVHRLGRTDIQYRKKYNFNKKGVSISKKYLNVALIDFKQFGIEVNELIEKFIQKESEPENSHDVRNIKFQFSYKGDVPFFTKKNFEFWHNDYLVSVKDIYKEIQFLENNHVLMEIEGTFEKVTSFYKKAKSMVNSQLDLGDFKLLSGTEDKNPIPSLRLSTSQPLKKSINKKKRSDGRRRMPTLEEIDIVMSNLPPKPWPIGVHKIIGSKTGIPKRLIYAIIFQHSKDDSNI
jgi:hypothetical protein